MPMSYFVKISDPNGVRKRLLESSKDLLHMLRGYHHLLEIRDEKREVAEKLRFMMKDLARLGEQLEQFLPQESLKEVENFLPPKKGTKKSKKVTMTKVTKTSAKLSEGDRLEKALANIEERLGKL